MSSYKILVWGLSYNPGGIENFIFNYLKYFDHQKIRVDFINLDHRSLAYETEFKKWGGKVIPLILPKRNHNAYLYYKNIRLFFKKYASKYDCMWFNCIDLSNSTYIKYAYKYNVRRIIVHSHNSKFMVPLNTIGALKGYIKHQINRNIVYRYATDLWACSPSAAKWLFPNKIVSNVKLINNAINPQKMQFNNDKRKKIRSQYGLEENVVIGNVGRLQTQKNQIFALRILSELVKKNPMFKMVFVGQGPDYEKLLQVTNKLHLEKNVLFAGVQTDMQAWYSSFDYFLFPSLFEGLSVASVEAQANGLPIFASDNIIPQNSHINSNVYLLPLNAGYEYWAKELVKKMGEKRIPFDKIEGNFTKAHFNIKIESNRLQKYFIK